MHKGAIPVSKVLIYFLEKVVNMNASFKYKLKPYK